MSDLVVVDRIGEGAARLTLQRPEKRNALSIGVRDQMSDALDQLAADETVKAVVITGAGDVFCAGFDLDEFQDSDPDHQQRLWASSDRWHVRMLTFPLPLVAAVNGPALAGGCDLAVMCDLRVAADTARFAHPEYKWAPVVYTPLHDLVGGALARDMAFTGRSLTAEEALAHGLVSRVVPAAGLAEAIEEVVTAICQAERDVLVHTKARIHARARTVVDGRLDV